ncbi:MAG: hypothetical protein HYR48_06320 [Gemmatimonadetes bacterium]|nr:hypothetical protein [Gemmatimonadota bacterium]
MVKRTLFLIAAVAATCAGHARAQDTTTAVRPGMTEADVRNRWGEPVAVRRVNDWTYLFYRNGLEQQWGFYDLVLLQNGQVVDAIVRAPEHLYLGQSSSPGDRVPEFTPPPPPRPDTAAGAVTGVRVTTPTMPSRPEF